MLEEQGVELKSPILYGTIRDQDGMLTSYKNGDRFVYVKSFSPPLPRKQEVGMFQCIVVHHGKDTKCAACDQTGHKIGDSLCKAKPEQDILAFKSFQHPFSNHFPCQLEVYDKQFKSVEHAFFWRMSTELGKQDLAKKIQESEHAGHAKRLSKKIADDETRLKWEMENNTVMMDLIKAKSEQCKQFRDALIESKDKILAEATPSKYWATGLSPYITQNCSPSYWPGQNLLGVLLMDLRRDLLEQDATGTEQIGSTSLESSYIRESRAGHSRADDFRPGDSRSGDSRADDSRAGDSHADDSHAGDSRSGDSHLDGLHADQVSVGSTSERIVIEAIVHNESLPEALAHEPGPTSNPATSNPDTYIESMEKKDLIIGTPTTETPAMESVTDKQSQHVGRPRVRNFQALHTSRNSSSCDRRSRSVSIEGHQQHSVKGKKGQKEQRKVNTPQHQDIRKAFEKRKEMETSPENPNDSKALRQDDT